MKKRFMILAGFLLALMLAACGSPADESPQDTGSEQTQATEEEIPDGSSGEVSPYAWLGLKEMPKCDYMDIWSTNHYYKLSDMYVAGMSYVGHEINAVDGINTYKEDEYSRRYSVEGKILSINEDSKSYMEEDMSDMVEAAKEQYDSAMKNGTNLYKRSYKDKGSEVIPVYSEISGDKAEYEYYEFNYPEAEGSGTDSMTERYYMKDGDVFAIYNKTVWGDTTIESTEVIKSMSGDIPEGTFKLPDISGYDKLEL